MEQVIALLSPDKDLLERHSKQIAVQVDSSRHLNYSPNSTHFVSFFQERRRQLEADRLARLEEVQQRKLEQVRMLIYHTP